MAKAKTRSKGANGRAEKADALELPVSYGDDDGDEANDDRQACPTCGGNGWVYDPSDGGTMTCPDCDGECYL